jgi:hypothetical protein
MQAIFKALGFSRDRTNKHPVWVRPADHISPKRAVPLDDYPQFEQVLIKRIIRQTGFDRVTFYCATEKTARKIR